MTVRELLKYAFDLKVEICNEDYETIKKLCLCTRCKEDPLLNEEILDYTINDGLLLIRIAK